MYCIRLYYTNIRLYWVVLYSVILIIIYHIILYKRVWTCLDIWAWGITEVNIAMSVLKRLITLWQGACDWWATASQTQVQDSKRAQQSRTVWSLHLSCKPFLIYLIRHDQTLSFWKSLGSWRNRLRGPWVWVDALAVFHANGNLIAGCQRQVTGQHTRAHPSTPWHPGSNFCRDLSNLSPRCGSNPDRQSRVPWKTRK